MFLSIIIPVYRVEATLNRCIESVVNQDFTDFEVILVDDGSPDNCRQLCDEWARKDYRIQVIHKSNGGLSDARNAGIGQAKGDYITFIDSDDYIGKHTFAPLAGYLKEHPETDIVEYPAILFYGSPKEQQLVFEPETVWTDMEAYWYEGLAYQHSYAWNKLYRASLFNDVRYPVGVVFEDICTLHRLLKNTRILATVNSGCYYYCYNPNGITATAKSRELRMHLMHHVGIIQATERRDAAFQAYYMQVLNIQIDVYEHSGDEPILPRIHVNPSNFHGSRKIKAFSANILGIKALCQIITLFHKLWKNH